MRKWLTLFVIIFSLVMMQPPSQAFAVESDSRAVGVMTSYGLLGGVALGVLSLPLTRDSSSIIYGALVGLYIGLGGGLYHIYHRDDPENPLRVSPEEKQNSRWDAEQPKPLIVVSVPVYRF